MGVIGMYDFEEVNDFSEGHAAKMFGVPVIFTFPPKYLYERTKGKAVGRKKRPDALFENFSAHIRELCE